jgi:hypothetical protein
MKPFRRDPGMIEIAAEPEACGVSVRSPRLDRMRGESVVAYGGGSYEIRIKGRLSESLLAAFEGLSATVEPVETVLHGPIKNQSSLHILLDRIQSLGLELVEIRRFPAGSDELTAEPEPPR